MMKTEIEEGLKRQSATDCQSVGQRLRSGVLAQDLFYIMEAHNGLSAKLAEEAGFPALWASGLTISASMGLRDSNEASWTQVLDQIEYITDSVSIPVLVDGDTGYGNFNNVRRLVRKLGERRVAGVCIEDKIFPKTNSFIGEKQPLADVEEFCGRLKAAKDSQPSDDFFVVARVEALISGRSMDEALDRAEAYVGAGADAILIHSKKSTGDEIKGFAKRWSRKVPLIAVPTTYYRTPSCELKEAGIGTLIWANQSLRAAITAMRSVTQQIFDEQSLLSVEERIATIGDIFHLMNNAELEAAEVKYLPKQKP